MGSPTDTLYDAFDILGTACGASNLLVTDVYGCYRDALMDSEAMIKLNGEPPIISSGDELFPGAIGIQLLDTDEVESGSLQCACEPTAAYLGWCSSLMLQQDDSSASAILHAPSPGTPDSIHSEQSCMDMHLVQQQEPWQVGLTADGSSLVDNSWAQCDVPAHSLPSSTSLVLSAASSMASLTSLLGYHDQAAAPAMASPHGPPISIPLAPNPLEPSSHHSFTLTSKRVVVRPRRAAAFVPTLPASSRGKRRGAPGGQPCKVAPNPDGHACTACGAQSTPVWRAGPHGPKTLCNACGVRYMKVAKKK